MKRTNFLIAVLACSVATFAQTKTTNSLQKQYENESKSVFFYHNTLSMLNQANDKALDELIKDIEKAKFLMIDKGNKFKAAEYKKLTASYKSESFEEIMTSRYQGKNFDVYLKDKSGKTEGMVVLVNDSSTLYILDIVGSIALDKVTSLYGTIEKSKDISNVIDSFTHRNDERSKRKDGEDDE